MSDREATAPVAADHERVEAEPPADETWLETLDRRLHGVGLLVSMLAAWTATAGSLYFSEVRHFIPCELCWFQRIMMYPLALILPIGLLRRDPDLPYYVLPLALLGAPISVYHLLLQHRVIVTSDACVGGVPCSARYIAWPPPDGPITIPALALVAFVIIAVTTTTTWLSGWGAQEA